MSPDSNFDVLVAAWERADAGMSDPDLAYVARRQHGRSLVAALGDGVSSTPALIARAYRAGQSSRGVHPELLGAAEKALREILAVSQDRERFVAQGPRGWAKAEAIARAAVDDIERARKGESK